MDRPMKRNRLVEKISIVLVGSLAFVGTAHAASPSVTRMTYDAGDHVTSVTDPRGLVTTYAYDGLGQLWQQTSPDTGTTTYVYDSYGRRGSLTRANGVQTTYGYDSLNRMVSLSAGGQSQTFTYDNCTNGIGRLCADGDATGTTSYSYTPEGRVAGRGFSVSGSTYALGYSYDALGHVTAVVYPDGNQALYSYSQGVVAGVSLKIGSSTVAAASSIQYKPMDSAMSGWTSSNGLVNTMSYDTDGRLSAIQVPGVQSLAFTYDLADRITQISNGINGNLTQNFGYDDQSRLVSLYAVSPNVSYQYDANGNRITQVVNGSATYSTISPTSNQLASTSGGSVAQYGYDAQGNLTTLAGAPTYHYNAFNRMDQAGGTPYYVNPEGQRLRKQAGGVTTTFAPDQGGALLAENQGGTWSDYLWLNGRLIGRYSNGQLLAIHDDQIGRPEAMTDATGAVVWRAQNLPFTRNVLTSSVPALNLGFPGQYYDAETGYWNNGFRDYDPKSGRYVQSDPIGLGGGINSYIYANNNPVSVADSSGLVGYMCINGNKVSIVLPISFIGQGNFDDYNRMASGITSGWTGQFGKYNVTMTVVNGASLSASVNTISVVRGYSDSQGLSRVFGDSQSGIWFTQASRVNGIDYAHEAGHLLGLPDESGTGTLMDHDTTGASPTEDQIDQALNNTVNVIGCGCK